MRSLGKDRQEGAPQGTGPTAETDPEDERPVPRLARWGRIRGRQGDVPSANSGLLSAQGQTGQEARQATHGSARQPGWARAAPPSGPRVDVGRSVNTCPWEAWCPPEGCASWASRCPLPPPRARPSLGPNVPSSRPLCAPRAISPRCGHLKYDFTGLPDYFLLSLWSVSTWPAHHVLGFWVFSEFGQPGLSLCVLGEQPRA